MPSLFALARLRLRRDRSPAGRAYSATRQFLFRLRPAFLVADGPPEDSLQARQKWLSNRVFEDYDAIVEAGCEAWNKLINQPETIMSIGLRDWAHKGQ